VMARALEDVVFDSIRVTSSFIVILPTCVV